VSVSGCDHWGCCCCWCCCRPSLREVDELRCCVNDGATLIGTACSKVALCRLLDELADEGNVKRMEGIESRRYSLFSDDSWCQNCESLVIRISQE
jgi:hypothetical protein